MSIPIHDRDAAVLVSGGVDSAILCVELLKEYSGVHPIYVRFGLRWEEAELACLESFLNAVSPTRPGIHRLTVLDEPIAQVYGEHWSNPGGAGFAVPGAETEAGAVYLPGRNILLATKSAVWCRLREVHSLAFGTLNGNPFLDSTPEFFSDLESLLNRAMHGRLRILRPFERRTKSEILRLGANLPLHLTQSCLNPVNRRHCGACNKCAERQRGFREAGWVDHTLYSSNPRMDDRSSL